MKNREKLNYPITRCYLEINDSLIDYRALTEIGLSANIGGHAINPFFIEFEETPFGQLSFSLVFACYHSDSKFTGMVHRTTIRVRQRCRSVIHLLQYFNIFDERIMCDALEEHDGKVSLGGRNSTNLRFADDIGVLAEEGQELEDQVESLDNTCTRYKMEISAEMTKLMRNSARRRSR